MVETELNVKDLFHFMNTHTEEFFIRVNLTEEGDFCGESDRCGISEISEGCTDFKQETDYDADGRGGTAWAEYV